MDTTNNTELQDFFIEFTNNVAYTDKDIDITSLNNLIKFAKSNNDVLTVNSFTPINSGTIALVFKGKLNDTEIVIKMLRKDIENNILNSLNTIKTIINIINLLRYMPFVSNFTFNDSIVLNLKKCLIDQCDFLKEIKNNELFFNSYKKSKNIVIPKVYTKYTAYNNKLIVMDFLEGKNINKLNSEELEIYHPIFNKYQMSSLLVKKIIHCDLHSGNIIFIKSGDVYKIGLIDFGICKKMNDFEYNFINNLIFALMNNDYECVFTVLIKNLIENSENIDKNTISYLVEKLLDLYKQGILLKNGYLNNSDFNIIIKFVNDYNKYLSIRRDICEIFLNTISSFNVLNLLSNNMPLHEIYNKFIIPDKLICK
jgi:predicted unusual protein kinase regulating ubiquinone biosynthesis (AarF/ABC1/UbiB family)